MMLNVIPIERKAAIKPPAAYMLEPSKGLKMLPNPDAALNIPKFFSRSSLELYIISIVYSPIVFAASEYPMRIIAITFTTRKAV